MTEFITHRDARMIELKAAVTIPENIAYSDGYFRYVDHARGLTTIGFASRASLINNTDIIRFDTGTIILMQERYNSTKA